MSQTQVGLADLLIAYDELIDLAVYSEGDNLDFENQILLQKELIQNIARLLHLQAPVQISKVDRATEEKEIFASTNQPEILQDEEEEQKNINQPESENQPKDDKQNRDGPHSGELKITELERDNTVSERPQWLEGIAPISTEQLSYNPTHIRIEPLLNDDWRRTFLQDTVSLFAKEGMVDIEDVINKISRGRPLQHIPYLSEPTMRYGLQLLIDTSSSTSFYSRDIDNVLETLNSLIPSEVLNIYTFEGTPLDGYVYSESYDDEIYQLPSHPQPILIISDLGIGSKSFTKSEYQNYLQSWFKFVQLANERQCKMIVLTPYELQSYPFGLGTKIPMRHWGNINKVSKKTSGTMIQNRLPSAPKLINTLKTSIYLLAKYCSITAYIDRELLRWMRLELLPTTPASLETEFWHSGLLKSSSGVIATMEKKYVDHLREDLKRDQDSTIKALKSLKKFRQKEKASYTLQLEEDIIHLAMVDIKIPTFIDDINLRVKSVTQTIIDEKQETNRDLFRWTLRAMRDLQVLELPPETRKLMQYAHSAATLRAPRIRILDDLQAPISELTRLLPTSLLDDPDVFRRLSEKVGVSMVDNRLEFDLEPEDSVPDNQIINLLKTHPKIIDVLRDKDEPETVRLVSNDNQSSPSIRFSDEMILRTLTGRLYQLSRAREQNKKDKKMSYRIFISHKNDTDSNAIGADLGEFLREQGNTVFFDKDYLKPGMTWQQEIIDELLSSDVVVVILNEGTAESRWVQRDIDMARVLRISVLPINIVQNMELILDALDRFDLLATQIIKLDGHGIKKITETYSTIATRIEPLSQDTRSSQQDLIKELQMRYEEPKLKPKRVGRSRPDVTLFRHPDAEGLLFSIATGDASRMRNYDVLVNSENNYMQMSRFDQTDTLSYAIRKNGAHMDGQILIEDTIQNELYDNVSKRGLPVPNRAVLATSAGHPKSAMKRNTDYRYILHAAAIRFISDGNRSNQPVGNIRQLIENCFDVILKIDMANGQVEGKNTVIVPADENYQPLTSILFPLFGAGEGGKLFKKSAGDIIPAFATIVPVMIYNMSLNINRVGLSIYYEDDVSEIENIFLKHGFEKVEE